MREHPELRDLLGPYVMGALGPDEEREVEDHLEACPVCRGEVRDLRFAHERLTDLASMKETPPRELKGRVLTSLPRRGPTRHPRAA